MKCDSPSIETGYGIAWGACSFTTGREAATKAVSSINKHALSGLLVYSSIKYDLEDVLKGIHAAAGDVPVFGSTTAGEICNGMHKESVVVVALPSGV